MNSEDVSKLVDRFTNSTSRAVTDRLMKQDYESAICQAMNGIETMLGIIAVQLARLIDIRSSNHD
jgi:hypothetical protein